jgi:carbon-monoxide dehydrogenase medium subunit
MPSGPRRRRRPQWAAASWPWSALSGVPARPALEPGEILVAILLPPAQPRSAAKYLRFTPRREMDIAIAGAGTGFASMPTAPSPRPASCSPRGADADPRALGRAEALGERPTRALLEEAGRLAPAMRAPSPTRAARPTIAARSSPC